MEDRILEKAAEILDVCGYAEFAIKEKGIILVKYDEVPYPESVDPFYSGNNTHRECLARRQADAVERWLVANELSLWNTFYRENESAVGHEYRLDRIKWCLEKLTRDTEYETGARWHD